MLVAVINISSVMGLQRPKEGERWKRKREGVFLEGALMGGGKKDWYTFIMMMRCEINPDRCYKFLTGRITRTFCYSDCHGGGGEVGEEGELGFFPSLAN